MLGCEMLKRKGERVNWRKLREMGSGVDAEGWNDVGVDRGVEGRGAHMQKLAPKR